MAIRLRDYQGVRSSRLTELVSEMRRSLTKFIRFRPIVYALGCLAGVVEATLVKERGYLATL
jgi:hypothetical protein